VYCVDYQAAVKIIRYYRDLKKGNNSKLTFNSALGRPLAGVALVVVKLQTTVRILEEGFGCSPRQSARLQEGLLLLLVLIDELRNFVGDGRRQSDTRASWTSRRSGCCLLRDQLVHSAPVLVATVLSLQAV